MALLVGCGDLAKEVKELAKTPIHESVEEQDVEAVKEYLANGGDANATDFEGDTLLLLAAFVSNSEIIDLLLEKGADVNAKGGYGRTPIHVAVIHCEVEVVAKLIEKGIVKNRIEEI